MTIVQLTHAALLDWSAERVGLIYGGPRDGRRRIRATR
jgi:hypothetical protein